MKNAMRPPNAMRFLLTPILAVLIIPLPTIGSARAACIDYSLHPHWISKVATSSGAWGVAVRGDYAYLTTNTAFEVIDVSNPNRPAIVGTVRLPASGGDIVIRGIYAYVADFTNGLLVIDVRDPQNPTIAGGISTYGYAIGLFTVGEYLYVSTAAGSAHDSRLQIFSVASDPTTPALIGMTAIPDWGWDVVVDGTTAYVAASSAGLAIVDVSDPEDPGILGVANTPGYAQGVAYSEGRVTMADGDWMEVVDVQNPEHARILGRLGMPSLAYSVVVRDNFACFADYEAGLQIVSISDPANPLIINEVRLQAMAYGLTMKGDLVYVADWNSLHIASIGVDQTRPSVAVMDTPGQGFEIAVKGAYAYIADYDSGVQVAQILGISSRDSTPHLVGSLDTPGLAMGIALNGNKAYVADGGAGLAFVSISNPRAPVLTGEVNTPGNAIDVAVADESNPVAYAYVADGVAGLQVIRVAGGAPAIVGSVHTSSGGVAHNLAVRGRYVYVADDLEGLVIVDVLDPAHPTIVSRVAIDGAGGVALSGTHVIVSGSTQLAIVDVADPLNPTIIGSLTPQWDVWPEVTVYGNVAYLTTYTRGVHIVDISDPAAPFVCGEFHTPGSAIQVTVVNCIAYTAQQEYGVAITPAQQQDAVWDRDPAVSEPGRAPIVMLQPSPNPTRGWTTIRFATSLAHPIDLQVLDAAGRSVRHLLKDADGDGLQTASWDGRDDGGHPVASGIYFIRLRKDGGTTTNRLVLLRSSPAQ